MQEFLPLADAPTIPQLVQAAGKRFGQRSALEEGEARFTFAELADAGLRAARAFMASGIERGDCVAIWAPNIHEWVIAAIGVHSAGATLVPLNTRLKGTEAAYILEASRARILCTVTDFLDTNYVALLQDQPLPHLEKTVALRGDAGGATSWEAFLASADAVSIDAARVRLEAVAEDDLSDMLFTSGTTGKPKGVMTEHRQNIRAFSAWSDVVNLKEGDRYLVVNPFFHAFGYKAGWLASILRGATILPQAVFDVPTLLERVGRERISVLPGTPTVFTSILSHPDRNRYDLSNLRLAVTGGAAVPVELVRRMRDDLGFESVVTGYGVTECCGIVSMCRHDDATEGIAGSSGRAIPGVEVRCVDADGKDVTAGDPGEVWVKGYNVMRGYLDNQEETRKAIDPDGWLHTGDMAVMDAAGNLRITDRIKDMFIMGGFNCYPAEIENLLYGLDGVAQVAVVGVPDERMGEVGMAFIVPEADAPLTEESVIAWCRENMANYKVPRRVALVDELPMNASGKVLKNELRERAERGQRGAG
jgi:acyl-CoA synthetase (AMP-forming)/AMP-acid ligase II